MTAPAVIPVRKPGGELHLCLPTGRGYVAACGKRLRGADLELPAPPWGRAWRLELQCQACEVARKRIRRGLAR